MWDSLFEFLSGRWTELSLRVGEHLVLTFVSCGAAIALGIPLGIIASRVSWLRGPLLGAIGILQTIPSLAMLAILLALLQRIGIVPAIIALTMYALLPIVRNTLAGLEGVSKEVVEAARAIGMSDRQLLGMVQLPMALPVTVAGIRTSAVVGVGIATLSAFIGAGGLGQFINRGLALADTSLILLGAIPAAILALLVDGTISAAEWSLRPIRREEKGTLKGRLRGFAVALPLLLVLTAIPAYMIGSGGIGLGNGKGGVVTIASKNFTEQFILAELMAQMIEDRTDLTVDRRFNLGGTMICHGALTSGEADIYPEYTGTGLTSVLEMDVISDPDEAYTTVRTAYPERFDLEWLEPFGFNNTYAITVRRKQAQEEGWETISDLEPHAENLVAGFTGEFMERPDGYPGLVKAYGFRFGQLNDLDPALMYEAVANKGVDVISAFATDGRIPAYNLKTLKDDRHFFPPYYAAPVARVEILEEHPEIRDALAPLSGALDQESMRRLNYLVDEKKRTPEEVAEDFLTSKGLLSTAGKANADEKE